MPKDYRYNPFDDVAEPVQCVETHIIPMNSPFVVRLNEVPVKDSPSTLTMTIGGVTATEVAAAPAIGEFRPDYSTGANDDSEWNTGLIQFNAADAGKIIVATYNGLGTLASVKAPSYPAWFTDRGDGSDGDYAPTASTTLAGGTYNFSSVNIPAGVTITLTGCVEIKCLGAFTCAGIITANGNFKNGGYGGPESDTGSPGNPGGGGIAGGVGGAGGNNPNGSAGGAGGGLSLWINGALPVNSIAYILSNKIPFAGGGGGGGAGTGYTGGTGGAGGGSIYITANTISVTGSITANGANGYPLYSQSTAGGGGGGGGIVIIANTISNAGTITASRGLSTGGSWNGAAGSNGLVYLKELGAV